MYLLAWLLLWAVVSLPVVLNGTSIPSFALRVHASLSANAILFLGAMHYLDGVAGRSVAAMLSGMGADRHRRRELEVAITTMPARPVLLITLVGVVLPPALSPLTVPAMRDYYLATSPYAVTIHVGVVSTLSSAAFGAFLYHTVRQLRIVSRMHERTTVVSPFRLQAVYGLSSLTARTSLVFVVIGAIAYATAGPTPTAVSSTADWPDPLAVGLGYLVLSVGTAAVIFAFPLVGLHRKLARLKSELESENDGRLERSLVKLHEVVDEGRLGDIDGLNMAIASLVTEREVIRTIPTWPWSARAFSVLVSAVLLPIVVWLLQYIMERTLLP